MSTPRSASLPPLITAVPTTSPFSTSYSTPTTSISRQQIYPNADLNEHHLDRPQSAQDEDGGSSSHPLHRAIIYHSNASHPHYFQGDSLMTYVDDNHDHQCHIDNEAEAEAEEALSADEHDHDMSDSDGGAYLDGPDDFASPGYFAAQHLDNSAVDEIMGELVTQETMSSSLPDLEVLLDGILPDSLVGFAQLESDAIHDAADYPTLNSQNPIPDDTPLAVVAPQDLDDEAGIDGTQFPFSMSNPHPGVLGPINLGLQQFLQHWSWNGRFHSVISPHKRNPDPQRVSRQMTQEPATIRYSQLLGEECDPQGINWQDLGVTRQAARERRLLTYKNYVNKAGSDQWHHSYDSGLIPATESFFRFRRMDIRQNVHLSHFQLRSFMACPQRSKAFYPGVKAVYELNPITGRSEVALDLGDMPGVQVSTLGADCGVLIAGTFNGEYCLRPINSSSKAFTEGQVTMHQNAITNHLQIHEARRSASPLVAFASNDQGFRIMDVETQKFISDVQYDIPMNCSALSPDKRLRVLVGDHFNVLITDAESGEILQDLPGHRDFGFACDWSDDGFTVATGFQDKCIKIWDARRWSNASGVGTPLCTIRTEMAGARSLKFSPLGSGRRVLAAAEEADIVNIIDAQTLDRKQTFDLFGEIGGIAFTNEGQNLNILSCDGDRGGLLQLERCGFGAEAALQAETEKASLSLTSSSKSRYRRGSSARGGLDRRPTIDQPRSRATEATRRLKAAFFEDMEPF